MSTTITAPQTDRKKYGPFRLAAGSHVEDHPAGGKMLDGRPREVVYTAQTEPFFSNSDLTKHNQPGIPPKFLMVGSASVELHTPLVKAPGESDEQYATRLRKLAEEATRLAGVASPVTGPAFTVGQLDSMSLKDLQKLADEEEVDLKGSKTPADAARIIKAAFGIK